MSKIGHILTAQSRVRTLRPRIVFSLINFAIALYLAPSVWLPAWLGASIIAQLIDRQLFANALAKSRRGAFKRDQAKLIGSVIVVATIFDGLIVYDWIYGGETGKLIACLGMACTLLHVAFTMYFMRRYMFAALSVHIVALIGLPLYSLLFEPARPAGQVIIVLLVIIIMIGYLIKGVQAFNKTLLSQYAAKASAHRARRKAEQALSTKFTFLATVSHELRTPMNAVVSSVHLLRETGLSKAQAEYVNLLDQASNVLLGLVNDVLDLSKIEAGKMKLDLGPVNLRDTFDALNQMWLPQARAKGLDLKVEIAPDVAPVIETDALRLKQILFNLLSNAVKFTHRGLITLRLEREHHQGAERCLFVVEDEGVGIAPDKLESIFLSFEQADTSTTRRYGGTGLGLSISQRLARLMDGDIEVVSVPGAGSRFTLSLPYVPVVERSAASGANTVAGSVPEGDAPRHVLIVDDHEVNRRIVSLFIAPLGWTWSMAADGEEAVSLCQRERFDLILMDMQMPHMNGIDSTRAIRAQPGPNRDTPVIALTANDAEMHGAAWTQVGVCELITKPVQPEKLIAAIRAHARPQVSEDRSGSDASLSA